MSYGRSLACKGKRVGLFFFVNTQIKFGFLLTYSYFDFVEDTSVRENPNKIWFSSHLFVSLVSPKLLTLEKTQDSLGFLLTYSYFDFVEDTSVRENPNKIWFSSHLFVSLVSPKLLTLEKTQDSLGFLLTYS